MQWKSQPRQLAGVVGLVGVCAALALVAMAPWRYAQADGEAGDKPSPTPDSVIITDPWARATPAGAHMGSIYMRLESANGDRLLRASVPRTVTAETQIHETIARHDGGGDSMQMRQVDSIELPPGQPVELEPGGYHLMLIHLKHPLKAGGKVMVTLRFERAGIRTVTAEVRGL